jgi:hypoxanthine phosphoribosyltransferase
MKEKINVLYKREVIKEKVKQIAGRINEDYKGKEIYAIGILKGCLFFMADLLREIEVPMTIHFVELRSYKGLESTGEVNIRLSSEVNVEGKDVLIIEDILDTGVTLDYIIKTLEMQKPHSIKACVLIEKPSRRRVNVKADYVGFVIPDYFVVGYGLDYDEYYRNLPYIGVITKGDKLAGREELEGESKEIKE